MDNNNKNNKIICTSKQTQIYEILNKIQNVINTESLIPQFIYFAKTMEEMRKKWLQSEMRCKDLEAKLNVEKSMFQRKINELKVDIEMHHEKRLHAENKSERLQIELDKMQRQFEMFKDVLQGGDKQSLVQHYEEKMNMLSTYNLNELNSHRSLNQFGNQNNHDLHMNNFNEGANTSRRLTMGGIEDTGSIISDYTEDDIDLPNDDIEFYNQNNQMLDFRKTETNHQIVQTTAKNPVLNSPKKNNNILGTISSVSLQNQHQHKERETRERDRESIGRKRNQRNSASLTRAGERRDKKRSRTRSNDLASRQQNQENIPPVSSQRHNNGTKAITTITTLKIGEDGRPITVTSEIKHNNQLEKQEHNTHINPNSNKMELSFVPQRVKNRKKRESRPSREFLQRSVDESLSTEDSEIFWNGDAVIDEVTNADNPHLHIMTPIVEVPTPAMPTPSNHRIYSNYKQKVNATPLSSRLGNYKSLSANSIPLSKKYKRPHLFKGQVILNSELCAHCDKRTKFGKMIMKCRECEMVVHNECKELLQRPCYPAFNFPVHGTISDYVINEESPHIPPVVQMIVNEIEARGLVTHEVGLYRVNGSDIQIKQLKERLIKRHQAPDLRKINDIHVLCSFLKDFLNNLTEHLITYESWIRFAKACEIQNEGDRMKTLEEAIQDLPEANRDTLSFIILHLQRISETPECKMPSSNLARVFGPSVVGNSSPNLPPAEIINELKIQHSIVENLIKLPSSFYISFVDCIDQQQQRMFKNNAKTPELMRKSKTATVLSSILGPATNVTSTKYNN